MNSKGTANLKIIDVSHHNKNVDYAGLKVEGYSGVIIKASQGARTGDDWLHSHYEAARAAGLSTGYYHYLDFTSDTQGQIDNFLNAVSGLQMDFKPVFDLEFDDSYNKTLTQKVVEKAKTWMDAVKARFGAVMLYCNPDMLNQLDGRLPYDYLWIAHYGVPEPSVPGWTGWQYTDANGLDLNYFSEGVYLNMGLPTVLTVDIAGCKMLSVAGWATAPSGVSRIDFYINDDDISCGSAIPNQPSPDVAANLGSQDAAHCRYSCDITLPGNTLVKQIRIAAIANDESVNWKIIK